ncbi:MAG: histidine--tRNA ligase [Pelagibacteraceae bacterium]|nr:histidine--tRNA ligase [Pelagibacteraceae bacterium]|tara:strand:- start:4230 stop:5462 length:1233 start_codon:yes stop_codon:yes gene_type:complete
MKIQPIRGTHDLFGNEIKKYNQIKEEVNSIANNFNFSELQTPIFESSNLFFKPLGEQSDVVLKEMYTFVDRGGDSLTLRPEYTTPMIRAAIFNNLLNILPCKVFGVGPMFRRERPQKGRYRQFNQINFENFGTENPFADVEIILLAKNLLSNLLPKIDIKLQINTLGDRSTLKKFKKELTNFFNKNSQLLSKESKNKIFTNPLRILDSKNEDDKKLILQAPVIKEFINSKAVDHYDSVKNSLNNLNIEYIEQNSLVRGLDYYCHTVFEFKTSSLGSQDTLIGGGRYDGLIKTLGGKDLPGVGWAGGIERIAMLMDDVKLNTSSIHFAILDEKFKDHALVAYNLLSKNNFSVYWNFKYNLKKSLSTANSAQAMYLVIIGEDEFNKKKFTVKNLKSSEQTLEDIDNIISLLK